jgi:hypothetical protein
VKGGAGAHVVEDCAKRAKRDVFEGIGGGPLASETEPHRTVLHSFEPPSRRTRMDPGPPSNTSFRLEGALEACHGSPFTSCSPLQWHCY